MLKTYLTRPGVVAASAACALAAVPIASAATVTVRVEGRTTTLLATKVVQTKPGSITRGGAPDGDCPAASAQGALADATRGDWQGKWYASYREYYITSILGLSETGKSYYWGLYVDNRFASTGACDVKLKAGDSLLFAVVPSKGKTELPLGIEPGKAVVYNDAVSGTAFAARVVYYDAKGRPHPLAGATVRVDGRTLQTGSQGLTGSIEFKDAGRQTLVATKKGYIRDETVIDVKAS